MRPAKSGLANGLCVFGPPHAFSENGAPVSIERRKDLALFVYLAVASQSVHERSALASLLWGNVDESKARHSLSQAIGRLQSHLPDGTLVTVQSTVRWQKTDLGGDIPKIRRLERGIAELPDLPITPFLQGFSAGRGAEDFSKWASDMASHLITKSVQCAARIAAAGEAKHRWDSMLEAALYVTRVDPFSENGYRMSMIALHAKGERARAIAQYDLLERILREELDANPSEETIHLRDYISTSGRIVQEAVTTTAAMNTSIANHKQNTSTDPTIGVVPAASDSPRPNTPEISDRKNRFPIPALVAATLLGITFYGLHLLRALDTDGVTYPKSAFTLPSFDTIYFTRGARYYAFPDRATFTRCTKGKGRIKSLQRRPELEYRGAIPSVTTYPWMVEGGAIVAEGDLTVYIVERCVRHGVPNEGTLHRLLGGDHWSKVKRIPPSMMWAIPEGYPVDYPIKDSSELTPSSLQRDD